MGFLCWGLPRSTARDFGAMGVVVPSPRARKNNPLRSEPMPGCGASVSTPALVLCPDVHPARVACLSRSLPSLPLALHDGRVRDVFGADRASVGLLLCSRFSLLLAVVLAPLLSRTLFQNAPIVENQKPRVAALYAPPFVCTVAGIRIRRGQSINRSLAILAAHAGLVRETHRATPRNAITITQREESDPDESNLVVLEPD